MAIYMYIFSYTCASSLRHNYAYIIIMNVRTVCVFVRVRACVCACMSASMSACISACISACTCACKCVCKCATMHGMCVAVQACIYFI